MGLKHQTVHATKWEISVGLMGQFVQLLISAVMARVLAPRDYGVFGMSVVFITLFQIFSQLGMGSALVQKKDLSEEYLSSVFWLNIAMGLILCLLYIASAPLIALFFREPQLVGLVSLLSVNFIISSLSIVQGILLMRGMRFKASAFINFSGIIVSGILAILLALSGWGVWSLAWSTVCYFTVTTSLFWIISPWRPHFLFRWGRICEILSFSLNVLAANVINYFSSNVQPILIGRFMQPAVLGYYSMANRIVLLPLQHIGWKMTSITFPAFSKMQDDSPSVSAAYLQTLFVITVAIFPLYVLLGSFAKEVVLIVAGAKWLPVIGLVRILSICGILQATTINAGSMLLSQGRADIHFRFILLSFFVNVMMVCVGLRWGVMGVAVAYTVGIGILTPIQIGLVLWVLKLNVLRVAGSLLPSMLCSVIMLAVITIMRINVELRYPLHQVVWFVITLSGGVAVYIASLKVIFPSRFDTLVDIVKIALPFFGKRGLET